MKAYFYDAKGSCIRLLHNIKEEPENQYPRALDVIRKGQPDVRCVFSGLDIGNGDLIYRAEVS